MQQDNVNETLVIDIAAALVSSGLRDAGYEYINLDAGVWSPNRTAGGVMQPDPTKSVPMALHRRRCRRQLQRQRVLTATLLGAGSPLE